MVVANKQVGVPVAAPGMRKIEFDILDPVNLSDGRASTSLGSLDNIEGLFDVYERMTTSRGQPVTFVYGNEQLFESGWKMLREKAER